MDTGTELRIAWGAWIVYPAQNELPERKVQAGRGCRAGYLDTCTPGVQTPQGVEIAINNEWGYHYAVVDAASVSVP